MIDYLMVMFSILFLNIYILNITMLASAKIKTCGYWSEKLNISMIKAAKLLRGEYKTYNDELIETENGVFYSNEVIPIGDRKYSLILESESYLIDDKIITPLQDFEIYTTKYGIIRVLVEIDEYPTFILDDDTTCAYDGVNFYKNSEIDTEYIQVTIKNDQVSEIKKYYPLYLELKQKYDKYLLIDDNIRINNGILRFNKYISISYE